jgi:hypothetical protein
VLGYFYLNFWYMINIAAKCSENKKSSNFLLVFQGLVKASGVNIMSCGCINHEWMLNLLSCGGKVSNVSFGFHVIRILPYVSDSLPINALA